jgi:hypothetical protein
MTARRRHEVLRGSSRASSISECPRAPAAEPGTPGPTINRSVRRTINGRQLRSDFVHDVVLSRVLNHSLPTSILLRADEVIE